MLFRRKSTGRPDLASDPRFAELAIRFKHAKELGAIFREIFKTRDCAEWRERLREHKITFSVVATFEDVIDDAQALENDMLINVEGHNYGRGQAVNSPFWIDGSDKVPAHIGSALGADGEGILSDLGYEDSQIQQLTEQGVLEI